MEASESTQQSAAPGPEEAGPRPSVHGRSLAGVTVLLSLIAALLASPASAQDEAEPREHPRAITLRRVIALDRERLVALISDTSIVTLHEDDEFRELAERLPNLQRELRKLQRAARKRQAKQ